MANIEELVIELKANTEGLQAEMKAAVAQMKTSTDQMSKSLEGFSKSGSHSTSMLQDAISTMAGFIGGQIVIGAIEKAGEALMGLFKTMVVDGIKAAEETQTALNDVSQALARNGNYSEEARAAMSEFADTLQETSVFGDEMALSAASMIENLTGLKTEGLVPATQAAADMASALNIDLNTAAHMVGMAIEGNGKMLKRWGIEIEEGSTKAETLANVMNTLNDKFGGAAAAKLKTYSGQTTLLQNTWADFTKILGRAVVENPAVINAMSGLNKMIQDISKVIGEAGPTLKVFIADLLKPMAYAFNAAAQGALFFASQLNNMKLAGAVSELENLEKAQQAAVKQLNYLKQTGPIDNGTFKVDSSDIEKAAADVEVMDKKIAEMRQTVSKAGVQNEQFNASLEKISVAVSTFANGVTSYDSASAAVDKLDASTRNSTRSTEEHGKAWEDAKKALEDYAMALAGNADTQEERNNAEIDNLKSLNERKIITDQEYLDQKSALLDESYLAEASRLDQAIAMGAIKGQAANNAKLGLEMKYTQEFNKIATEREKAEADRKKKNLQDASDFFGNLTALSGTHNKTLSGIAKAAAIAQATINTYAAASKALLEGGPFAGPALAISITAAGLANVAKIASTPLATGIDEVPGVGVRDNFPALLAPGERVVPASTNEDLKEFLANQGQSGPSITVHVTMNDVFTSDPREMGMKLIETINEAAQANGVKLLGSSV